MNKVNEYEVAFHEHPTDEIKGIVEWGHPAG